MASIQKTAPSHRYGALYRHYGIRASRDNPVQSHENGTIESRHRSRKKTVDQALLSRGMRGNDFSVQMKSSACDDARSERKQLTWLR